MIHNRLLVEALGWAIVHSLWQIALLALLCAIALSLLRNFSANLRYWIGMGFMTASLIAFVGTLGWHYSIASPPSQEIGMTNQFMSLPTTVVNEHALNYWHLLLNWIDEQLVLIVTLWLVGVVFFSIRLGVGLWQTQRLRTVGVRPVDPLWEERLQSLIRAMNLQLPVQLAESVLVRTPVVVGWLRPVILLPVGLLTTLSPSEIECILAHELAHIRRCDFLLYILQSVAETLLFYHPGIWWLSAQINQEREHCCDDIAIGVTASKLTYARALAELAQWSLSTQGKAMLAVSAAGKSEGSLFERIKRILQPNQSVDDALRRFPLRFVIALVLFAGALMLSSFKEPAEAAEKAVVYAQKLIQQAEEALTDWESPFQDTTKKKTTTKVTVIKQEGPQRDTVVVEGDEVIINLGHSGPVISHPFIKRVDSLRIKLVHIDSLMRKLSLSDSSLTNRWDATIIMARPSEKMLLKIDSLQMNADRLHREIDNLHIFIDTVLTLRHLRSSGEESEHQRQLLEKTLEQLRKNQQLSKKQLEQVEKALQKALEEASKQQHQRTMPKDEFIKIDSLLNLRTKLLQDSVLEKLRNLKTQWRVKISNNSEEYFFIADENSDYFINGKPATKEEFKKIPLQQIKEIAIEKKNGKSIVRIITK